MIELYKKHGLVVYWLLLLLDCWDNSATKIEYQGEYGYYLKGLLFLSLILLLSLNFNKRHHTNSKWLIFSALTLNVIGHYFNIGDTPNMAFIGYSFFWVANLLFVIFMYRLSKREEVSSKEPFFIGALVMIGCLLFIYKSKADFAGFTYFAYAYGMVSVLMLVYAIKLYSVKNKKSTALNCFIPAAVLTIASGIVLVVLRISGEKSGFNILKITEILCSGYAIALMTNGAKKVLK